MNQVKTDNNQSESIKTQQDQMTSLNINTQNGSELMSWIDRQTQIHLQRQLRPDAKSLDQVQKKHDSFRSEIFDDYDSVRHCEEKFFGNKKICPKDIDKQMVKFLYKRIDPHNTMKRICYSKAPQQSDYYSRNQDQSMVSRMVEEIIQSGKSKSQGSKRMQSEVQSKNSTFKFGIRPQTQNQSRTSEQQHINRISSTAINSFGPFHGQKIEQSNYTMKMKTSQSHRSRQNPVISQFRSKKELLIDMQQALRRLQSSRIDQPHIDEPIEFLPEYYQPKNLLISHIQPNKFNLIRKELRWWPLEKLQRHLLKKYNDSCDIESVQDEILQTEKKIESQKNFHPKQRQRALTISNPKNYSVNLLNNCNNYLEQSKQVKEMFNKSEKSYKSKIEVIINGEEESREKNYEEELTQYEKLNCQAVLADLRNSNKHFKAFRMYNSVNEKQTHHGTRKMIGLIVKDQQRIAIQSSFL